MTKIGYIILIDDQIGLTLGQYQKLKDMTWSEVKQYALEIGATA